MNKPFPIIHLNDPPKPAAKKRKRKPVDWAALISPKSKRLAIGYWILREGMVQEIRRHIGPNGFDAGWWRTTAIRALEEKGYLEAIPGPKGAKCWRTTGAGAFAALCAEGIQAAHREKL